MTGIVERLRKAEAMQEGRGSGLYAEAAGYIEGMTKVCDNYAAEITIANRIINEYRADVIDRLRDSLSHPAGAQ